MNREIKTAYLDRYDPSNMFNFMQRETYKADTIEPVSKTYIYDSATKAWSLTSSTGRVSSGKIDAQERPISIQNGTLAPIQILYDSFGNVSKITQGKRVTSWSYDANGFLSSRKDALAQVHTYSNDTIGRVTQQRAPSGDSVDFQYDRNSNLTSLRPFGKDWHQLAYNLVDLFSVYQAPAVGSENTSTSYTYNLSRDLQKISRPDGKKITYGYDSSKARVTSISMGTSQINLTYDSLAGGNVSAYTNLENNAVTNFQYNANTILSWYEYGLQGANVQGRVTFNRDKYGRIVSLPVETSLPNQGSVIGNVAFTYDVDNFLLSAGALQISRSSDNGLVTTTQLGSISDSYSYNSYGEVIGYLSTALPYNLIRDDLGRITQKTETILGGTAITYNYFFDGNDRLFKINKNGATIAQYTFDGNGNRTSVTAGSQVVNATFDAQDRILQFGANQYSFNSAGELKQKVNGTNITQFDFGLFGQLKNVQLPSGKIISYNTNGLGFRIAKSANGVFKKFYLWQSITQLAAEIDFSAGVVSRFIYGTQSHSPDYMIKGGVTYRFIKDQVGSIRLVVDASSGMITQQLDYDEWGNVLSDSNPGFQPFAFAGGLYDPDTRLVHFGARDYDPEVGRWISKDPSLFAGGLNLYGYSFNDPLNFVDSNGKNPVLVAIGIGAAVGAVANVAGSYFVGTLTRDNFLATAGTGGFAGGAAVLTAGTAAIAGATTLSGILAAEVGSGFIGTITGAGIDIGLNLLSNPPNPYPTTLQPRPTPLCPQ